MEERMRVAFRVRLNGRIPDPQGKYRDEITQEATFELEDASIQISAMEKEIKRIRQNFYTELKRLGGYDYREK